jgi:hypothetical protein
MRQHRQPASEVASGLGFFERADQIDQSTIERMVDCRRSEVRSHQSLASLNA